MTVTEWKLEDQIQTKEELTGYLSAAIEEADFDFMLIACREVLEIAKKKGWIKKEKCRKLTRKIA